MIRWLVIALFIYLMIRLISGPRRRRRTSSYTFRFNHTPGANHQQSARHASTQGPNQRKPHLDQIEDAEFEDITEKETTEKKSD